MPPKKDPNAKESHYYGFDSTGLEKAAAVTFMIFLYPLGS